jgi:DNA-directed RNA polymerase specialized sigma24 family protein
MLWPNHGQWPWPSPPPSPFDVIARKERRELIDLCLVDLTRENVKILRMRYYRDLSFKDVARALDSSEDAVMQMHGRVLDKMRDRLKTAGVRRLVEVL